MVLHIQLKLNIWVSHEKIQVKFEFGLGLMIFGRVMPFNFENNLWNFQFLFIISQMVLHIQLKLHIWICYEEIQVKFEFGYGSMNFGRVMPLLLWKWYEIFSFRSLSPQWYYTFNSKLTYMDTSKKCVGQVRIWSWFNDFWQSYVPFTLKIIWNFQFRFIISYRVLHIQLKIDDGHMVKIECCHGLMFLAELCPFNFEKKGNFQFPFIISPTVVHIQLKLKIWICHQNA
jgi:hypothetical protein